MLMKTLETALSLKRAHGSETEAGFVAWLCTIVSPTMIDGAGNIHVEVGESRTLFTAHTDTMHNSGGINRIRKTPTHWYADGDVLGADDGCGIALLVHMIRAEVPGHYIFFRGEEQCGIGASWLAENMKSMLSRYDRAIAFDRAGLGDVITHQSGVRGCSDAFAYALSEELSKDGLLYLPDTTGMYTDTAEMIGLVPECTNISVGYNHQHGVKEELNIHHFLSLAAVVTTIDWEALPTKGATREDLNEYMDSLQEQLAVEAIEAAIKGNFNPLLEIFSDLGYSDCPSEYRHPTKRRLGFALEELEFGYPVASVMAALCEELTEII